MNIFIIYYIYTKFLKLKIIVRYIFMIFFLKLIVDLNKQPHNYY